MNLPECEITFCRYFKEKRNFDFENEVYSEYVIFCIYSGMIQYRIGEGQNHTACAGQVIMTPPGKALHRKMLIPSSFLMLKINTENIPSFSDVPITIEDKSRFMQNLEYLECCNFCFDFAHNRWWLHYCMDIWYQLASEKISPHDSMEKIIPQPIQELHELILQKYTTDLSVSDLARTAGFSTAHFINTFRKYYNCTPKQYLLLLRIQKAQLLLETTSDSIQNISKECGFHDEFYFSRLFHQHTGMSPTEYKKVTAL